MGGCCEKLKSFAVYSTVKIVTIKDPCLGFLHYALLAIIFLYILVYRIIGQNGYAKMEDPIGTVRIQLQGPTVDACDPDYPVPVCDYNFTNVEDLDYCSQSGKGSKLPCRDMDALDVVYPVTGGSPFFISTRVQESNQTLVCQTPSSGSCKQTYKFGCHASFKYDPDCPREDYAQTSYYPANIEDFTLLIDHSVRSPTVEKLQADSVDMVGYLEGCNGEHIMPAHSPEGQDIFKVGDLLAVMQNVEDTTAGNCGLTLDERSSVKGSKHSVRYDGMIMIIVIEYSNTKPFRGPSETISYNYRVEFIKGTKSKITQRLFESYPHERVTRDMHGIKVVTLQTGRLGSFDVTTLLLELTTSLTLLAISTTIVDMLATRVLKDRRLYKRAKYVQLVHDDSTNRLLRSSMGSAKDAETAGFAQGAGGADDAAAEAGTYGALHDTREPVN